MEEWVAPSNRRKSAENYDRAAAFIERQLGIHKSLTILVDEVDPLRMDPLLTNGWNTLLAMLVLAFPEVRWHFLIVKGRPAKSTLTEDSDLHRWSRFRSLHGITALHDPRGTPLFDGYGLRKHVFECIFKREREKIHSGKSDYFITGSVPFRSALASVLDEEEGYRWLLACIAYRHGFRVCAIASWTEAERLLGPGGKLDLKSAQSALCDSAQEEFVLSIEDWYLSYPDQNNVRGMSNLENRSQTLPALGLGPPPLRRFVTVGHEQQQGINEEKRDEYLTQLRKHELDITGMDLDLKQQRVYKPASGFITLWEELGLKRDWNHLRNNPTSSQQRQIPVGLAPGFTWPPDTSLPEDSEDEIGHSSPGRLLQIAEHLITRANTIIDSVNTVKEAVRGAVLATQALELLGCKTPTVSVEALLLKNAFEIIAECQFVGVEYHLSMKERLRDIHINLLSMSRWIHQSRQRDFQLNAKAMIITKLDSILAKYGEYEESEYCQRQLRKLHYEISILNDWRRRHPSVLFWPFRAYIEWVLRSSTHFIAATIGWVIVLLLMHLAVNLSNVSTLRQNDSVATKADSALSANAKGKMMLPSEDPLYQTMSAMLTGGLVEKDKPWMVKTVSYFAAIVGIVHLGVLVALLYSKSIRRSSS